MSTVVDARARGVIVGKRLGLGGGHCRSVLISILEYLLNELYSFAKQIRVQFLELGKGEGVREVIAVFKDSV